jgi:hypothetical protein
MALHPSVDIGGATISQRTALKLAAFATAMAVVAVAVPAAGKASPQRKCDAHGHGAALVTREVVIWGRQESTLNGPATVYAACFRPNGASVTLGVHGPDQLDYGFDATTRNFLAAGSYVAAHSSKGEATLSSCAKYGDTRSCPPPKYWIRVADTKTLRHVDVRVYVGFTVASYPLPTDVPLALSPKGALAWLESGSSGYSLRAAALHRRGRSSFTASSSMLDMGQIDPHSLRFVGRTLHWVREGNQYQRALT